MEVYNGSRGLGRSPPLTSRGARWSSLWYGPTQCGLCYVISIRGFLISYISFPQVRRIKNFYFPTCRWHWPNHVNYVRSYFSLFLIFLSSYVWHNNFIYGMFVSWNLDFHVTPNSWVFELNCLFGDSLFSRGFLNPMVCEVLKSLTW